MIPPTKIYYTRFGLPMATLQYTHVLNLHPSAPIFEFVRTVRRAVAHALLPCARFVGAPKLTVEARPLALAAALGG